MGFICVFYMLYLYARRNKEEEEKKRRGKERGGRRTRLARNQDKGAGGGLVVLVVLLLPLVAGGCAFFSSSAWLYRIKASRSRTLLSAFTQAAEKKERSLVFFWYGFVLPYCVLLLCHCHCAIEASIAYCSSIGLLLEGAVSGCTRTIMHLMVPTLSFLVTRISSHYSSVVIKNQVEMPQQ